MKSITPRSRPQMSRAEVFQILQTRLGIGDLAKAKWRRPPIVLGVRGYYRDTMGAPGKNDRGIYDDALFACLAGGAHEPNPAEFMSFNANLDPGVFREGIATLVPGVYRYKLGIHGLSKPASKRYPAFVQAEPVKVSRDGGSEEIGFFGINIHRGGLNSVSSEGCQTVVPSQWPAFFDLVNSHMRQAGTDSFLYVLDSF